MTNTITSLAIKVFADEGFRFFNATYFEEGTGLVVRDDILILGLDDEGVLKSAAAAAPGPEVGLRLEELSHTEFDHRREAFAKERRSRRYIMMSEPYC